MSRTQDKAMAAAGELLAGAKRLLAFTGAGISAASGIPTYRGDGGLWSKYEPDKYANINYFRTDPSYYWRFFRDLRGPLLASAEPNAGHQALARLEAAGRLAGIITQNIDGLHQEAGSEQVWELHGNTRRFPCEACGRVATFQEVLGQLDGVLPPRCPGCQDQALRPDVVLFGESLPTAVLTAALEQARQADVMLVVGSSLVVQPAAQLPVICTEHGGRLIIVNVGETALDPMAEHRPEQVVRIDAPAAEILPALIDH